MASLDHFQRHHIYWWEHEPFIFFSFKNMHDWKELPGEILGRVFEYVRDHKAFMNHINNDLPLFLVCKAWRHVAFRIFYHTIEFPNSTIEVWDAVKNEMAGHYTRNLTLRLAHPEYLKQALFHFAAYCPYVTTIKCPSNRELAWTTLTKNLIFEKLTEIPEPKGEWDMEKFNACAWKYRDQLKKQYALAYRPFDPRINLEIERLKNFPRMRQLIIYERFQITLLCLDKIVDAFPQITSLGHAIIDFYEDVHEPAPSFNKESHKPHENIVTLDVSFPFNPLLFDYLAHKFPNLTMGEIRIKDVVGLRNDEHDRYNCSNLGKLLEFTSKNHHTIHLSMSLGRLKNKLKSICVKKLELDFFSICRSKPRALIGLIFSREGVKMNYPLEVRNGISGKVTSDVFKDVWCSVSANTTYLRIKNQWPLNEYAAFDIFMDIFKYGVSLSDLVYEAKTRLCMPQYFHENNQCNSLKSLSLVVYDIDEDIYPVFSKCCPQLTRLKIHLGSLGKQRIYRIIMPELHFKLFKLSMSCSKGTYTYINKQIRC